MSHNPHAFSAHARVHGYGAYERVHNPQVARRHALSKLAPADTSEHITELAALRKHGAILSQGKSGGSTGHSHNSSHPHAASKFNFQIGSMEARQRHYHNR